MIKNNKWIIILLLVIFFLLSYKYKIEVANGATYRINQITGDIRLIQDKNIVEMDKVKRISAYEKPSPIRYYR